MASDTRVTILFCVHVTYSTGQRKVKRVPRKLRGCYIYFRVKDPGKNFGEKNASCALIDGDSRDPFNSRQFLADRATWR